MKGKGEFSGGTHLGTAFQTEGAARPEAVHVQAPWVLLYCGVAMTDTMGQMGGKAETDTEDQPLASSEIGFDSTSNGNKQNNNSFYVLENTCVFAKL